MAGGLMAFADGNLLLGAELDRTDGPWQLSEDLRKSNLLFRWSRDTGDSQLAVDAMAYQSKWTATDQIPQRAVQSSQLDRFGFVDPSNGGESHRRSLSVQGNTNTTAGKLSYNAYAIDYRLQLFSNFTYALNPVDGDQVEQFDDCKVLGAAVSWQQPVRLGSVDSEWRTGLDLRRDDIDPVGLHLASARRRHLTIREDAVEQTLTGLWTAFSTRWTPWLRSELGVRADRFDFDVSSPHAANSGSGNDTLTSPKISIALAPWRDTEVFLATGRGFHSNDARGTTITVDPNDGVTPVDRVTPLAAARGSENGLRTALIPRTQLSIALWQLDLASELLFIGDGSNTETTRPGRRRGVELGLYARPRDWLIIDADCAWSKPRFRDSDPAGDRIPGAVEAAASLAVAVDLPSGWFGGLRMRFLGPAALIEDNSVRAPSSTLVNLNVGRRIGDHWKFTFGLYNLFDRAANDITYFYASQLPGESAPVEDLHFHPAEPRSLCGTVQFRW